MNREELQNRMMKFAVEIIKMTKTLPLCQESRIFSNQIIRSSSSVAANYRSAGRGKSHKDFISKLATACEECDETLFWLEMITQAELLPLSSTECLGKEASELLAILTASLKTAKSHS
jgi:four helix bundle protein